ILDVIEKGIWKPDLIHANDWQTALLPVYLKTLYKKHAVLGKIKTLFTIHNMAYQGLFPIFLYPVLGLSWDHFNLSELEFYNQINLLKGGIVFADAINTVSPTYAQEIQTEEYGCGLEGLLQKNQKKLTGILNRVDYAQWSPERDVYIPMPYNASNVKEGKAKNKAAVLEKFGLAAPAVRQPLFGVVSRITPQKGCDLIASIIPTLIRRGAQIVILGKGDPKIEDLLRSMERQYPDACGVQIEYNTEMSHLIEAGADMFLMPSRFEPCGLNQMYSLLYGTIPIARSIGGLADTVLDYHESDQGNGFTFDDESTGAFMEACDRAITVFEDEKAWSILVQRAMQADFSWRQSAEEYIQLYRSILYPSGVHPL
ncbi:MAG: glycogen synthase, partial [Candidatus Hinthialibacter sp.]